jgi:cell division topological specificity factor
MNFFEAFGRRRSASVARERLQILLTHERRLDSKPDLIPALREDILKAVAKHVAVDPEKVQVTVDRGDAASVLEINIEVPAASADPQKGRQARAS